MCSELVVCSCTRIYCVIFTLILHLHYQSELSCNSFNTLCILRHTCSNSCRSLKAIKITSAVYSHGYILPKFKQPKFKCVLLQFKLQRQSLNATSAAVPRRSRCFSDCRHAIECTQFYPPFSKFSKFLKKIKFKDDKILTSMKNSRFGDSQF